MIGFVEIQYTLTQTVTACSSGLHESVLSAISEL